ncbi:MAG: aminoglycoside adenylyltransferase domain-containing protein [Clostridia bacterium]
MVSEYDLVESIDIMVKSITDILHDNCLSVYLYGSVCEDDFRLGWSDIDILCLTKDTVCQEDALRLVDLRKSLSNMYPDNEYYRLFEGGILSLDSFISKTEDTCVYWGSSGSRITIKYDFNSLSMTQLIKSSKLLYGKDILHNFSLPSYDELKNDVINHYETIRKYAKATSRSIHSYGWLLDISRCIYTIQTGKIISKTRAGEWALENSLCPVREALGKAVEVRMNPNKYITDKEILDYSEGLGEHIQKYADVLEETIKHSQKKDR